MRGFHFCIPIPSGNAGDDVLNVATREMFAQIGVDQWTTYNLRDHVTAGAVAKANEHDVIVVGGGGLFLRDTNPNDVSGWQWKCPLELLAKFQKPLIVASVGYNRFRGQEPFAPIFQAHVRALIEKAAVFTLRNSGSKRALAEREGIPVDKVDVCPCPSLFIQPRTLRMGKARKRRRVGIQLAGDRLAHRIENLPAFTAQLQEVVRVLRKDGCEVVLIEHSWSSEGNLHSLAESLEGVSTYDAGTLWSRGDIDRLLWTYRDLDCVIAMRGHGQMIPFGQGTPVVSLVSHDKLKWFLEDAGMDDWCVEADELCWGDRTLNLVRRAMETTEWQTSQKLAMDNLHQKVHLTLEKIRSVL